MRDMETEAMKRYLSMYGLNKKMTSGLCISIGVETKGYNTYQHYSIMHFAHLS